MWDGKTMHDDSYHVDQEGDVFECSGGSYANEMGGMAGYSDRQSGCIVLQFTGEKDDNGAKLFETDVVDTELGHAVIGFQHGFFCLNWLEADGTGSDAHVELLGCTWKGRKRERLVRLGNSLENPELLKG